MKTHARINELEQCVYLNSNKKKKKMYYYLVYTLHHDDNKRNKKLQNLYMRMKMMEKTKKVAFYDIAIVWAIELVMLMAS